MNRIRTSLLSIGLIGLVGLIGQSAAPAMAQTGVTNLESGAGLLASVTNISVVGYGAYVKDTKKVGGGVMAIYNFNDNVGTGFGAEVVDGSAQVINGNITLRLPIKPLGFLGLPNVVTTPWAAALLGRAINSSGASGAALGTGGGLSVDVADLGKGWALNLGGGVMDWTGAGPKFNGLHILGFLGVHHGF